MTETAINISIGLKSSREIFEEICFGSYRFIPQLSSQQKASKEMRFEFVDYLGAERSSNPFREAEYILSLLSVLGRTDLVVTSQEVNQRKLAPIRLAKFSQFEGKLILPKDAQELYSKLLSFSSSLFEKYVRSCMTYQKAVSMLQKDPTLGCYLLVVAIECLSDTLAKGHTSSSKFYHFICSNSPLELIEKQEDKDAVMELLKQVWKIYRVGFTHGGKPIPLGALVAEKAQRRCFTQMYKGKVMKFPSITWFESLVRDVLIEFLRKNGQLKSIANDRSRFKEMALSESIIVVKLKKPKQEGEIVFDSEIDGFE